MSLVALYGVRCKWGQTVSSDDKGNVFKMHYKTRQGKADTLWDGEKIFLCNMNRGTLTEYPASIEVNEYYSCKLN